MKSIAADLRVGGNFAFGSERALVFLISFP